METNIFKPMVIGWSEKLTWTEDELKQAAKLLSAISKANGGEIAPDVELDAEINDLFALQQVEGALARWVAPEAKEMRARFLSPKFTKPLKDQSNQVFPELVPHEWKYLTNINTADVAELSDLPGVGPEIALRIVDYRQKIGSFSTTEQLLSVDGIGDENFAALKDWVFCGGLDQIARHGEDIFTFMQQPTFQNYVRLIDTSTDPLAESLGDADYPKKRILAELEKVLDDVKKNPYGVAKNLHYTRASKVLTENARKARATEISEKGVQAINCGALLYDVSYFEFLEKLIEQAAQSIMVMMFFMKFEEGTEYVTNALVEALIKARAKGLDVKVILDRDAEGGRTGARLVNQAVFDMLRNNNVSVVFDHEDRMTHSKFVIVDGKHVVLGSHNWTGGSYWAYDDTSVYIESKELALKYQDIFIGFWDEYNSMEKSVTS